jgi:hypothetical protein
MTIILTFSGIVVNVCIFGLKKAKMAFLEGISPWNAFLGHYPIQITIFIITGYLAVK